MLQTPHLGQDMILRLYLTAVIKEIPYFFIFFGKALIFWCAFGKKQMHHHFNESHFLTFAKTTGRKQW